VINDIKMEARERMEKSLEALVHHFNKIRTGRAHPSLLDGIRVEYYGAETPLSQMANISVEDARTLSLTPWDKSVVPQIERAIMKSDLGLNPSTAGGVIRIPMPMLTEETRKGFTRQARGRKPNPPGCPCAMRAAMPWPCSRSWSRTRRSVRTTSAAARKMYRN
jgi:ribosome recycling factor